MAGRSPHPLAPILAAAASGRFPPADGAVEVLPPDGRTCAVVAFSGHAYVLADVELEELVAHRADGFGGASKPGVLTWLAGPGGEVGSLDAVLVARGRPGVRMPRRMDLDAHRRVRRAAHHRRDVEVYG
ncbi:MAG: hypothetical protein ACRDZ2_01575, partial [Ilumatobacteraceae bacterium]